MLLADYATMGANVGTLAADESVELTATVTETISAIHFDDGDRVEKDQVLVEMTSGDLGGRGHGGDRRGGGPVAPTPRQPDRTGVAGRLRQGDRRGICRRAE